LKATTLSYPPKHTAIGVIISSGKADERAVMQKKKHLIRRNVPEQRAQKGKTRQNRVPEERQISKKTPEENDVYQSRKSRALSHIP
jgi:glutamate synthase domain-containing protein 1